MTQDPGKVVVSSGLSTGGLQIHHRDFPEIRAEGESPTEAASYLINKLNGALDTALTDWRRQGIETAIADVSAFADQTKN